MWSLWSHRKASAECAATRAKAGTDHQDTRPGTTAAVSAVPCQGPGRGVDQVEGDELKPSQAILIPLLRKIALGVICGTAHQRACWPGRVNTSVRSRAQIAIHFGGAGGAERAALTYEISRTARIASLGWINHRLLARYWGRSGPC